MFKTLSTYEKIKQFYHDAKLISEVTHTSLDSFFKECFPVFDYREFLKLYAMIANKDGYCVEYEMLSFEDKEQLTKFSNWDAGNQILKSFHDGDFDYKIDIISFIVHIDPLGIENTIIGLLKEIYDEIRYSKLNLGDVVDTYRVLMQYDKYLATDSTFSLLGGMENTFSYLFGFDGGLLAQLFSGRLTVDNFRILLTKLSKILYIIKGLGTSSNTILLNDYVILRLTNFEKDCIINFENHLNVIEAVLMVIDKFDYFIKKSNIQNIIINALEEPNDIYGHVNYAKLCWHFSQFLDRKNNFDCKETVENISILMVKFNEQKLSYLYCLINKYPNTFVTLCKTYQQFGRIFEEVFSVCYTSDKNYTYPEDMSENEADEAIQLYTFKILSTILNASSYEEFDDKLNEMFIKSMQMFIFKYTPTEVTINE